MKDEILIKKYNLFEDVEVFKVYNDYFAINLQKTRYGYKILSIDNNSDIKKINEVLEKANNIYLED